MSSISYNSGPEGPRHDPYAYDEVTIVRDNGRAVVAHLGLDQWIEVNGSRSSFMEAEQIDRVAETVVGISISRAQRALRKKKESEYRAHRGHGGMEWREGFPGESFLMCRCGHAVDYSFNESAII
jgi:hypothetical protein